jgi:aspartate aminotransferase
VFRFAAGEPDFDTPPHIKAAAIRALEAGQTKYAPVTGLPALRAAIAEKLLKENGLAYTAAQVVVCNGAKEALFNVLMTLCGEGDEVIIPSPYWLSYPEMVRIAGGKSVFVEGREADDFKVTAAQVEKAVTARTRAIVVNSPSNPIGCVYTEEELRALGDLAVRHALFIVSDEIYEKMVYGGARHVSVGSLSKAILDRTITVNGFSKAYAMTGWRLGYFAGPSKVVEAAGAMESHSTSGANTFAQFGAVEALKGPQECVATMVKAFEERGAYLYQRLTAIKGVTCVKPSGAFYILANISVFGLDSLTFAERLLAETGVAVIPGVAFGTDRHIRFSYACGMDEIRGGLDAFETFVKGLKR